MGTTYGSGTGNVTNTFDFNRGPYDDINIANFSLGPLTLGPGTYYLNLKNAVTTDGGYAGWDVINGPSVAYAYGAPTAFGSFSGSNAFDILGTMITAAPEPNGMIPVALGAGIVGLLVMRRKMISSQS
jgi:hypothetical protein